MTEFQKLKEKQLKYLSKVKKYQALVSYIISIDNHLVQTSMKDASYLLKAEGLVTQLQNPNISLSVVAEVSNGKSTFLNALIFKEQVLHSGLGAVTARLFKVDYGENYTLTIDNKTTMYESVDTLKEAVEKLNVETREKMDKQNQVTDRDVLEVSITLPHNALKEGITIYDTPGFGALDEALVYPIIQKAIAKSDAIIMLLDIAQGMKKSEKLFIKDALPSIPADKRFVVFNKIDSVINEDQIELMGKDEIDKQLAKVQDDTVAELSKITDIPKNQIISFTLSAQKALIGFIKKNQNKIDDSFFEKFEVSFWEKVIKNKNEVFVTRMQVYDNLLKDTVQDIKKIKIKYEDDAKQIKGLHNALIEKRAKFSAFTKKSLSLLDKEIQKFASNSSYNINIDSILTDISKILEQAIFEAVEEITWVDKTKVWNLKDKYTTKIKEAILESNGEIEHIIKQNMNSLISSLYKSQEDMNIILNEINKKIIAFHDIGVKALPQIDILGKDIKGNYTMNSGSDFSDNISLDKDIFVVLGTALGAIIAEIIILRLTVLIPGIGVIIGTVLAGLSYLFKKNNNPNKQLAKDVTTSIMAGLRENISSELENYISQSKKIKNAISFSLSSVRDTLQSIENSFENPQEKEKKLQQFNESIKQLNSFQLELNKLQGDK